MIERRRHRRVTPWWVDLWLVTRGALAGLLVIFGLLMLALLAVAAVLALEASRCPGVQ